LSQLPRCKIKKTIPTYDYEEPLKAIEAQHDIFWLPTEPKVEKDLHCLKTELTEAELHGVMTTLSLFTTYEILAGNEYWGDRFKRIFPRPEFERMGSCFSNIELNVHTPFYQKVDEILGLANDDFYSSFVQDPTLKSRMDFLDDCVNNTDDLYSVGVFSMVEGSILYSSFAFLMHFQAESKNLIPNIHSGLTFSVKDENLHSEAGAWAYRNLLKEEKEINPNFDEASLSRKVRKAGEMIFEHEQRIIEMVFSKGSIRGITAKQMENFVMSRINICLQNLGLDPLFEVTYNPVAKWFYKMIGGDTQHDFFYKLGSGYNRDWSEKSFVWRTK
jgi:ribonucleoside-diphosphate reductase beta chain